MHRIIHDAHEPHAHDNTVSRTHLRAVCEGPASACFPGIQLAGLAPPAMRTFHSRIGSVLASGQARHPRDMNLKHRIIMQRLALGITASTAITATANAPQPWIDTGAMGRGMQHEEASGTEDEGDDDASLLRDPVADDPALLVHLQQRMARHRRQLLPEYQRRRLRDGPASADRWLRREARERGEREAEALQRSASVG
jgi:hypothetical protein